MKITKRLLPLSILLLCASLYPKVSFAEETESVESFLRKFHANPARMMERLPSYVDKNGNAHPRGFINRKDPEWKKMIKYRTEASDDLFSAPLDSTGPTDTTPDPNGGSAQDNAALLVEPGPMLINPQAMENRHLNQSAITPAPWADSYWPMYKGLTATRYMDRDFPNSSDWQDNYSYYQSNPPGSIAASGDANQINELSPAEKYDVLMGDMNFTLTNYAWNEGEFYYNSDGSVASWMGICHGWSGAAHMQVPYPKAPVTVKSASGVSVVLYPQDVKALESMMWAYGIRPTRFAGNRCTLSDPPTNANGRILDPNCFDVSPSTWHESIVNQVGVYQRSFVLDATYDVQVWNFPIVSYSYGYFNPQTWQQGAKFSDAMIPMSSFTVDKFPSFRSPQAKYIVGVYMDLTYVVEIQPALNGGDVVPPTKTVRYYYDLELDQNQNIVGTGEWYQNAHPDFVWTFNKGTQASAMEDRAISGDSWSLGSPIPATWSTQARSASSRGIPLQTFLGRLSQ